MWDSPRQLNVLALSFALVAVALLAWGVGGWAVRQPLFGIRKVVIEGPLQRADAAHLRAVVREELSGTFFTLRLAEARASLERVPWVKTVGLRREWPGTLRIEIAEHQPLARWNDAALVDTDGEVFAADFAGALPQLEGPEGSAALVAARFRDYGGELASRALAIAELKLSARGGWRLRTAGGAPLTIELGRSDPAERLARFVAYYGRTVGALARAGKRIEYADLRYGTGFAVRVPALNDKSAPKKGQGTSAW